MLRHLDLFSGIGGFALAARMVGGYETVSFCEIEPYCQAVLRKHWPGVPIYDDVRTLSGRDTGPVDIITGGFPCQDISNAGKRAGIDGERSGLWAEYCRLIGELRPRFVLVENVAALTIRGLLRILGDLAENGYDAFWRVLAASDIGAWHERARIWIVAYPMCSGLEGQRLAVRIEAEITFTRDHRFAADSAREPWLHGIWERGLSTVLDGGADRPTWARQQWPKTESVLCRVDDGIPDRVGRTSSQGNAIVPQVAAIFLQAIKDANESIGSSSVDDRRHLEHV
jgi:DNA (cytosine-5)-methyltransferase 1